MTRPETTEYAPYFDKYISLVPDVGVVRALEEQLQAAQVLFPKISQGKENYRYAPDKWSVKEVFGHIIDAERVFAYRALRFGRGDVTPLPSFDQDVFAANVDFSRTPLKDLAEEFTAVRSSTLHMLRRFDESAWLRCGVASDNPLSARAAAYIIAGHELYHLDILKNRYL